MTELPIIQKTYDLIKWYIPIVNRLPRDHGLPIGNLFSDDRQFLVEARLVPRGGSNK